MLDAPPSNADPSLRRPKRRMRWRVIAAAAFIVLIGAAWLILGVLPYNIIQPGRSQRWADYHGMKPTDGGLAAEDMWVEAEPGLWLAGWRAAAKGAARGTIILLHGSSSCKESQIELAKLFADHGWNSVAFDARAHGESGSRYCTFGYYERRDVARIIEETEKRFGPTGPIAIHGDSMGAAVALQTLAVNQQIVCGVLESPFATLPEIIRDYMQHYSGVPFAFISNLALWRAGQIAHFNPWAVRPENSAAILKQPVLLAHGTDDHWISWHYGERIARQFTSPASVWMPMPGADHGGVWQVGGAKYKEAVFAFLDQHCR